MTCNLLLKRYIIKICRNILALLFIIFVIISCRDDGFNESLLYGKWRSGTLYYRYNSNGTGVYWDVGEDVSEEEGKKFKWDLKKSEFNHLVSMELNGREIPFKYTLIELTSTKLRYKDVNNSSWSFTKVE
jgi:hypothetical protein